MPARILVVDDDDATRRLIALGLRSDGHMVETAPHLAGAIATAEVFEPEILVTDLNMAGGSGIELSHRFADSWPDVPVIVITAFGTMAAAIDAMRAGAYDFVIKPFDLDALALVVGRALQHRVLKSEVKRLRAAVGHGSWGEDILGKSPGIVEMRSLIERVSRVEAPVLLTGETGTGKEVTARVLHQQSRRHGGPFVTVDCSASPETLLEVELFGRSLLEGTAPFRHGAFGEATGGTLLLEEIGELSLTLQAKLVRALETRRYRPVSGNSDQPIDARIIAATRRDLQQSVLEGSFREDLLFCLGAIHIAIPPLRSRGTDVLLLAQRFLTRFADDAGLAVVGLSESAAERLITYPWPGNIRELRNAIERGVSLTPFDHIRAEDLPERICRYHPRHVLVASDDLEELVSLEEVEKRYILNVLKAAGGNKSLTAQKLGIGRRTLYRKLGEYQLDSEENDSG